ncbi:MAG: ATP-dependent RecD-like DNA helicase [Lachnospiraceae bacterium]|nr:ATP-dependent RecD-like DNA helicase [Lachnospiraceae bacterium]MBP3610488.1 ATP-dependent RecD-like DNA helicase [Lachnospiraceae bacterium]
MAQVKEGYVERIVYRGMDGYAVLKLSVAEEEELTCFGTFVHVEEGEYLRLEGEMVDNPKYGEQLKVLSYQAVEPKDGQAMERYLASGAIKGVGAALAARIVKKFKEDTFRIIEEEPERLVEVKGISERIAGDIYRQFEEKREMRHAMIFLQQYGISNQLAVKIYQFYGERMYDVIRQNPYKLAEDIDGVGFKIADEIALQAGIAPDDEYRVKAALYYVLTQAIGNGHVFLPEEELYQKTLEVIRVPYETMERQLTQLVLERSVVLKEEEGQRQIYVSSYYYLELDTARMLCDLNQRYDVAERVIAHRLHQLEKELEIELDELQQMAVSEAVQNGVFILTGGPGTGKTTTINTIIRFFESEGMDVLLAAPTGRAAKRMSETTGMEARTIHRMLELTRDPEAKVGGLEFARNESNPLESDVIIIDEMSMVDISLMHALLKAILVGTRVIFVGDVNQLPSVGPGNVLQDMIASERFPVVKLTKIFRQSEESKIVLNAHKINAGESIPLDNNNKDFFFLNRQDTKVIVPSIVYLVQKKIADYVKASPYEVQVLTPMKAGELGAENLNIALQEALNPAAPGKIEKELSGGRKLREGDKVMQIKNNYQLEWETRSRYGIAVEKGTGVFNGDCGIIREINLFAELVTVEFEEGRMVEYPFGGLDELVLAYAITIHKSQGSEYPAVVIPLLTGPRMLFNRNVLYTAVTRAKKCVTIVGSPETVQNMIHNVMEAKRYSGLKRAIQEM